MVHDTVSQLRDQLRTERAMRQKLESEHNRMVKAQMESGKEIQVLTQLTIEQQHSIKILQGKIEEMERSEAILRRQLNEKQAELKRSKALDSILKKEATALEEERARRKKLELLCKQYEHDMEDYRNEIKFLQAGNRQTVAALKASEDELLGARYAIRELGTMHAASDTSYDRRMSVPASPAKMFHNRRQPEDQVRVSARQPPSSRRSLDSPGSKLGHGSPYSAASVTSQRPRQSARSIHSSARRARSHDRKAVVYDIPTYEEPSYHVPANDAPVYDIRPTTPLDDQMFSEHYGLPLRATPIISRTPRTPTPPDSPSNETTARSRGRSPGKKNALDPRNRSRSSERSAPGDIIKTSRMLQEITPSKRQ